MGVSSAACGAGQRPTRVRVRTPRNQPIGEMDLVEVDIVRLQFCQRLFDPIEDIGAHQLGRPPATEPVVGCAPHHFRRDNNPIAVFPRSHPVTDVQLGAALRLGPRRDWIKFGSVKKVDAPIEGAVELGVRLFLGILLTPSHRTEAN